jgi:hypothetical protein
VFSQSGATATCTYTKAGTEDTFTVPSGVSRLAATAVGAPGGAGISEAGGFGALVSNTALPVPLGASELWVDVGGPGTQTWPDCTGAGGSFDGGSGGSSCSGGGGGSSALLKVPRANATLTGKATTDSRLLVAGGGGGSGQGLYGPGGSAGAAVTGAGAGGGESGDHGAPGGVGPTDGTNGGGAGGGGSAVAGTAATGGAGGDTGGGGGGGWFGGGGGYFVGGGGGGSSYGGAGPSGGISIATASASASQTPEVVISYTPPTPSDLAAILVSDSTGLAPGTALRDKATAIQTAVNANQTATACAGITEYLGVVKTQTGKKLTRAQANQLTTDANNLAAALGC